VRRPQAVREQRIRRRASSPCGHRHGYEGRDPDPLARELPGAANHAAACQNDCPRLAPAKNMPQRPSASANQTAAARLAGPRQHAAWCLAAQAVPYQTGFVFHTSLGFCPARRLCSTSVFAAARGVSGPRQQHGALLCGEALQQRRLYALASLSGRANRLFVCEEHALYVARCRAARRITPAMFAQGISAVSCCAFCVFTRPWLCTKAYTVEFPVLATVTAGLPDLGSLDLPAPKQSKPYRQKIWLVFQSQPSGLPQDLEPRTTSGYSMSPGPAPH